MENNSKIDEESNQFLTIADVNKILEEEFFKYKVLVDNPKIKFCLFKLKTGLKIYCYFLFL